jgi:peptidoglycan/LPS O-acetylase OafA/YrhL
MLYYVFGFNLYEEEGAYFTPLNIVANMLMVATNIDAVMWSMKAELAATPLIFLCVWLFRRYGERPVTAIAWALFGLSVLGQYRHAIGPTPTSPRFMPNA